SEPDPHLGPPGPHGRLDRPPTGGHGAGDRGVPAPARAERGRRRWRPRARARRRHRSARRGRRPDRGRARGRSAAAEEEDEEADSEDEEDEAPRPARRRGRRGGRSRRKGPLALEGTFDHGEEGYGLWLDPSVQDDPIYAEHWAGHRPVEVTIEEDQIVIRRAGGESDD